MVQFTADTIKTYIGKLKIAKKSIARETAKEKPTRNIIYIVNVSKDDRVFGSMSLFMNVV